MKMILGSCESCPHADRLKRKTKHINQSMQEYPNRQAANRQNDGWMD
jgi:hypothetical protein